MRRVSGVLALVAVLSVAAAAAGGQQTAAQTVPTVALKSAVLKSKWKESFVVGGVRFSGVVSGPAELRATLRPRGGGRVANAVTLQIDQPGPFGGELTLPARLLPKVYRLTISGTSSEGAQLTPVHRDVRLQQPPEGIVDYAYMSATRGGKRANTLNGKRLQIFARFHFVVAPLKGERKKLRSSWHSPDFKFHVEPHKQLNEFIDTFVLDTTRKGLMKGVWFCYLRSTSGYIIKKTRIRLA
jgi:hypothetical protein